MQNLWIILLSAIFLINEIIRFFVRKREKKLFLRDLDFLKQGYMDSRNVYKILEEKIEGYKLLHDELKKEMDFHIKFFLERHLKEMGDTVRRLEVDIVKVQTILEERSTKKEEMRQIAYKNPPGRPRKDA